MRSRGMYPKTITTDARKRGKGGQQQQEEKKPTKNQKGEEAEKNRKKDREKNKQTITMSEKSDGIKGNE